MDSSFTPTIDWLVFTVLASNPKETMKVLVVIGVGPKAGSEGIRCPDEGRRPAWGGQTGHECPPRRPNEIHVDLSGGLASAPTLDKSEPC